MAVSKVLYECVLFLCALNCATSFNLEPRIPVIKSGTAGSYFGFSVAEHQEINNSTGSTTNWLLVGAPLDQNYQPNTTRSGALWKCPLTTRTTDCEQVVTDGKRTRQHAINMTLDAEHLYAPHPEEIKNGQWLGVSVRSQGPGGKVVVCAHRYIRKTGQLQFGQGLCYTLSNELELNPANVWEPCRGRPVLREHEEYGYCQVGTSSTLLEDNTLLLGSPGPFTWRGTIFTMDTNDNLLDRDDMTFMAPVTDNASPVEKYSYLGMSVVGAKFFGNMSYATGAPRAHGTGQVVVFSKRDTTVWGPQASLLNVSLVLDGEQFGSSFGYEISSADVNGDGYPDLLVGAPFYFTRDTGGAVYLYVNDNHMLHQKYNLRLTGRQESQFGISIANAGDLNKDGCHDIAVGSPYEGNGAVYIYLGHKVNGLSKDPKQVITAESLPRTLKTFGYSLSGGVDLDMNGYPDLLVGAYENSSIALIRSRPIIDIKTYIVPATITNIDPGKHGCESDPAANYTCFHFEACCTIVSLVKTSNSHLLNYVIEAETFPGGRKFSRVFFGSNPSSQKSNIINKTIALEKDQPSCIEHIVYLKENTRDIQTPIRFQLNYSLVQSQPVYRPDGAFPNMDDFPVLNATASNAFSAVFLNDCGPDGVCTSDLVVEAQLDLPKEADKKAYTLTLGQEEEIRLAVRVDNLGESAYEAQMFVHHHVSLHYIAANVTDKHIICKIHNSTVIACLLGNPFKRQPDDSSPITLRFDPKAIEDNEPVVEFSVWVNSTSKEKELGRKPVVVQALVVKNAELYITGIALPEQVFYGGEVKGESAMNYLDDIGSRVVHTFQVFNEGPWRVTSVQVVISWPHQVANDKEQGKWLLYPEAVPTVEGEHPAQSSGECLVYGNYTNPLNLKTRPGVEEAPLANLKMDPFLKSSKTNVFKEESNNSSEKHTSATENRIRRKRDNEMVVKAEAYTDKDGLKRHAVNMNCQNKTAKCIQFQCVIYKLARNQGATISIRARLWNSTLVEDYPRVSQVNIASTAFIRIPEHYNIHQNDLEDDTVVVQTVAYPDLKTTEPTEIPLWVIIVSVIAGLLVLILLIIALWKFGFFKRSRPDPTLSGNLEKNNHEGSPFLARDRNSLR